MARQPRTDISLHRIYVACSKCGNQYDEEKVESINIEEDIQGRNVLTFRCPICKKNAKSLRRG